MKKFILNESEFESWEVKFKFRDVTSTLTIDW